MTRMYRLALFSYVFLSMNMAFGQVSFTANDSIGPYNHPFGYGANMGYYPGWTDKNLADIAGGNPDKSVSGAGINGMRPALFEHFLEYYGYDIRIPEFKHYEKLGITNNTVFVGYPSEAHKDKTKYCPSHPSEVFANLYTPIWDDGANGTPVNDENFYALYLYKMVTRYKDYVKVWEIWNEPDFDFSANAWKPASFPESWWNEAPDPCDYALYAPPSHYIRMLRISWEVIKTFAPETYVAVGGLGYAAFLKIILEHTDNPDGGTVSDAYPLKGGAYFDMLSYHSYPHIDGSLRAWSNEIGGFKYDRNSDAAITGMLHQKGEFDKVLQQNGYTDHKYPKKHYIITECNIPRKAFGDFIGSEEAQVNFLMKALVACQQNEIHQFHVYNLGELGLYDQAESEYQLMGLFQKLEGTPPYQQTINKSGIAYKTMSDLLMEYSYDQRRTSQLALSQGLAGAAFKSANGKYRYVLWAKTNQDMSEAQARNYSFPADFNLSGMKIFKWDHSATKAISTKKGNNITLSGQPIILEKI